MGFSVDSESGDADDDPLWRVALHYQELKSQARAGLLDLSRVRKMAIKGILRRTLKLLRRFRRKTHVIRRPWTEGDSSEIALIETLEHAANPGDLKPEDILIETREEKPLDLALMIDTSLSMTGRKLALCAIAAGVLSLRLRADAYSLIAFGVTAKVLKPLGSKLAPQDAVLKILDAPLLGCTNIDAVLVRGAQELRKGRAPLKVGVLLTDGKYTEGKDPEPAAGRFRRLEVLMIADRNMDQDCCERMARAGRGHVTEVRRYRHLPERLLTLLRALQR